MKKVTVLMTIATLAIFMIPVIGSADDHDHGWKHFHGTYQMSGSGSCLHSSVAYYQDAKTGRWTAPDPKQAYAGTTVLSGTWVFENGGGTYSQTIYATILPGGDVTIPVEVRVLAAKDVAFTYEITPSGDITVTQTNNGIQSFGSISIDKKAMTLLTANNVQQLPAPFGYTICNTARTLIKVDE
jgi:hypothetical protein